MGRVIGLLLALGVVLCGSRARAVEQVSFAGADGKLQLQAHWFAVADTTPRPAVVALHGCGGALDKKGRLAAGWAPRARSFNAERMHVLVLDSFSPRGLGSICEIRNARRTIDEEARRGDVFAAMHWLAAQPAVDASRIVLAGWSHGAQTVLSALDATDQSVRAQTIQPRAAVAFYPGCKKFSKMLSYELGAPLLLLIGELDDWTPAADCQALGRRLGQPGQPAFEMKVYPASYHGFDGVAPVKVRENLGNTRTGRATVGGNPLAREQAQARMFDFLAAQLGTPLTLSHEQRLRDQSAVEKR